MGKTPIDSHHPQVKKSRSTFRTENPSASNSESVSDSTPLPHELITEILLRLPVKSLLKSKCVSKSWLSLISSPQFIRSHFSTSSREGNYHLLFTTLAPNSGIKGCSLNSILYEPSTHVFDVECPSQPFQKPYDYLWIVGIVNGLVCLAIEEEDLFLWNPVLRKSKHLPSLNISSPEDDIYVIYGFGYDESNDDYKVVCVQCVYRSGGEYETEVKVYSLLEDSWRRIEDFKGGIPLEDSGKYVNGKIHWTASDESSASCQSWKIVTLDMESEKYGELQRPGYEAGVLRVYDWVFGVLGGRLFVLCEYYQKKTDLWVMDKYGVEESWSKVVSIPYVVDVHAAKPQQILCILRNGEIVLANGSCLLVYHPKHNEFRNIELGGCISYYKAFVYVESLVWPNEPRL